MKDSNKVVIVDDESELCEFGHNWECYDEDFNGEQIIRYLRCNECGTKAKEYYVYSDIELE